MSTAVPMRGVTRRASAHGAAAIFFQTTNINNTAEIAMTDDTFKIEPKEDIVIKNLDIPDENPECLYLLTPGGEVVMLPDGWIVETLDTSRDAHECFGSAACTCWCASAGHIPPEGQEHMSYCLQVGVRTLAAATPISRKQAQAIVPHLFSYLEELNKE